MKEIVDFLAKAVTEYKRILVLCHHNADPDAVGSSIVLAEALRKLGGQVQTGVSESISQMAQNLLNKMGREITVDPSLDVDIVVLVDTSSLEHLGKLGEQLKQRSPTLVLVDHHREVEEMKKLAELYYVNEEATSESELILKLVRGLGVELNQEQASLLLAGIIADTGQLKLAKNSTFEAVYQLVKAGADYQQVLEMLRLPEDLSKRAAMLKAAQRVELHKIRERLVVFSELSSFEADAAAMLVKMGADVAVVSSEKKDEFRLCARARPEVCSKTNLHLGQLVLDLAKKLGGTGGGHAGAASASCRGELKSAKEFLLDAFDDLLKPKGSVDKN